MTYPPHGGAPEPYQDPYAQQQHPQYGPPPYAQQPYHGPVATTNTLAILALVFAFVFAPAAIFLGHAAKKQIAQTGEQGEGLATAGLILGYVITGVYVAICAFYVIVIGVFASGANNY